MVHMKCVKCRTRFSAAWAQPAPGGSKAPGVVLGLAAVLFCATAAAFALDLAYLKWIGLGIGLFFAMRVPIAWVDCRSKAGLSENAGGVCPECGVENSVRLWSL